jgi:CRP/FNR family transcriptional regulator, cyclic AMP receptor protein
MSTQEIVTALGKHTFLRGMAKPHLEALAQCAQQITLTADQFLGREREAASTWYLIQSGRVEIQVRKSGRGTVRVLVLGPGDIVGWSWLVPPHRWQFDARVLDSVQALALDAEALRSLCDSDHELGYQILKRLIVVVSIRLAATQKQVLAQQD